MPTFDVIEFFDPTGEIIVSRFPQEGSGDFNLGSQLIVQESQTGVFFRDGKALDGFPPGRHTLSTENLPLLKRLVSGPFGKSPFRAYVYFVSTKTFTNLGWGTPSPVLFRDSDLKMVMLRAHGSFAVRITGERTFLNTLVGTRGIETTFGLHEYLRNLIVSRLTESIGKRLKSILDLPVEYSTIAAMCKKAVEEDFNQYGIQLVDMIVEAITPPQEVQDMINKATGIAVQDTDKYKAIATADAIRAAADNPGGTGQGVGLGVGLGVGFGMMREMAGQFGAPLPHQAAPQQAGPQSQTPAPAASRISADELEEKLTQLKGLMDKGIITESEFAEQKKKLLERL
ncbi:MAG: SPFH domain-containing protein [Planctomycetes bacterium]|nr:SPFH domain-containing protein [Planctomycetota bacterium]